MIPKEAFNALDFYHNRGWKLAKEIDLEGIQVSGIRTYFTKEKIRLLRPKEIASDELNFPELLIPQELNFKASIGSHYHFSV